MFQNYFSTLLNMFSIPHCIMGQMVCKLNLVVRKAHIVIECKCFVSFVLKK
jgi:hypothetical protein